MAQYYTLDVTFGDCHWQSQPLVFENDLTAMRCVDGEVERLVKTHFDRGDDCFLGLQAATVSWRLLGQSHETDLGGTLCVTLRTLPHWNFVKEALEAGGVTKDLDWQLEEYDMFISKRKPLLYWAKLFVLRQICRSALGHTVYVEDLADRCMDVFEVFNETEGGVLA